MSTEMVEVEVAPIPAQLERMYQELRKLSDAELDREFGVTLDATSEHFMRLAVMVRIMEERGRDLSELKNGMIAYLRKIAYGQLLPEIMADFGHRPSVLKRLSMLPMPDQAKAYKQGVEVGVFGNNGGVEHVKLPISSLNPEQVKAVFAPDHIRTPEEQIRFMRFQNRIPSEQRPEPPAYVVNKGKLIVSRPATFTKRMLENILKMMRE